MSDELFSVFNRSETVNDRLNVLLYGTSVSAEAPALELNDDLPIAHPDYFVSFQIAPCVKIDDTVYRYDTLANARLVSNADNSVFYSLYGHLESGQIEHIRNAANAVDASQFLTWMTGQRITPSNDMLDIQVNTRM